MNSSRALIVGGGPAGTSAALGFLRAGWNVTLLEQRSESVPRVCGAFLNPEAVRHLAWLGLLDGLGKQGAPVASVRVTGPDGAEAVFPIGHGGFAGLAVARDVLEETLLKAVAAAGGEVHRGRRAGPRARTAAGWTVRARHGAAEEDFSGDALVLADGRFGGPPLPEKKPAEGWFGWNAAFDGVPQPPGALSLHFYFGGYVGLLTFADGTTNVCGLRKRRAGEAGDWDAVFKSALVRSPALAELLSAARRRTPWGGVGPLPFARSLRPSDGALLAGDAGAVADPFMGEGIGRALGAGPLIVEALESARASTLSQTYARLWRHRYRSRFWLGLAARTTLGSVVLFRAVKPLFGWPRAMNALTPLFHGAAAQFATMDVTDSHGRVPCSPSASSKATSSLR